MHFTIKQPDKQARKLLIFISFFMVILSVITSGLIIQVHPSNLFNQSSKKDVRQSEEKEDRSKFYELDKIVNSSSVGNQTMGHEDYLGLVEGKATLEGLISIYGLPTHVIGASEGDEYLEACFSTDEIDYSVDLVFVKKETGFGDWVLETKSVVENEGIDLYEYSAP